MEQIKAKFQVSHIQDNPEYKQQTVNFHAVYGGNTNAEDNTFSAATPSANLSMTISNPAAQGFFKQGKKYYAVFTEAAE